MPVLRLSSRVLLSRHAPDDAANTDAPTAMPAPTPVLHARHAHTAPPANATILIEHLRFDVTNPGTEKHFFDERAGASDITSQRLFSIACLPSTIVARVLRRWQPPGNQKKKKDMRESRRRAEFCRPNRCRSTRFGRKKRVRSAAALRAQRARRQQAKTAYAKMAARLPPAANAAASAPVTRHATRCAATTLTPFAKPQERPDY